MAIPSHPGNTIHIPNISNSRKSHPKKHFPWWHHQTHQLCQNTVHLYCIVSVKMTLPISDTQVTKIKLVIKYQKKYSWFKKGYYFAKHFNFNQSKGIQELRLFIPQYWSNLFMKENLRLKNSVQATRESFKTWKNTKEGNFKHTAQCVCWSPALSIPQSFIRTSVL